MKKFCILSITLLLATGCSDKTTETAPAQNAASAAAIPSDPLEISTAIPHNPKWKTFTLGSEANYPPFEYRNNKSELIGFEIDIVHAVAQEAGFNPHIVFAPLKDWEESLQNKQTDGWASAFVINERDKHIVHFSKPFLDNTFVLQFADKPENARIQSAADLRGKKISVSKYYGKETIDLAARLSGSPDNVVIANSIYLSIRNVYTGAADAVIGEDRVLDYFALKQRKEKLPPMRTVSTGEPKRQMAFIVAKNNPELLNLLNTGLDRIHTNGRYEAIMQKWFGKKP